MVSEIVIKKNIPIEYAQVDGKVVDHFFYIEVLPDNFPLFFIFAIVE